MGKRNFIAGLVFVVSSCAVAGCSAEDGSESSSADVKSDALAFHGEADALPDFHYDTGLVPASSPAQVQMKLSAAGGLTIDAEAMRRDGKLAGKAGSGKAKIDIHVGMEGRLKVDTTLKKYDGDLPGLKDVNIAIAGETPFDPFLTGDGEEAKVTAEIPEADLPPIPLGSVPGSLKLHVAKGSKLTSAFHGTCMSVAGGKATYAGETKTGGTLVISAKLALDLPKPLDKEIDLPPMTIEVPETTAMLDLGSFDAAGIDDSAEGQCAAAANGDPKKTGTTGGSSAPSDPSPSPSTDPTTSPSTPPPSSVSLKIDGVSYTIGQIQMWSNVSEPGMYDLFVQVTGPGAPAGSDIFVSANHVGTGCTNTSNYAGYRPEGDTQYMPNGASVPTCGLTIDSLPTKVGEHFHGSYFGTWTSINATPAKTKNVELVFDVTRTTSANAQ